MQTGFSVAPANKPTVTQIADEAKHQTHGAKASAATAAQPPLTVKFGK